MNLTSQTFSGSPGATVLMGGGFKKSDRPILTEVSVFSDYKIVEGTGGEGKPLVVEGVFQRSDTLNENGRIYPRKIWERALKSGSPVMEQIESRGFYGELDHPDDGRTLLQRVAHIVTGMRMDENGVVIGRAEILPTPAGKVLEALFRAGARVGISSRGSGEVTRASRGEVVKEDFELEAFDFVYNPSTPGAYPRPIREHTSRITNVGGPSMEAFDQLEEAANEVLSINLTESNKEVSSIARRQAAQVMRELSELAEADSGTKLLAAGLIAELQAFRRKAGVNEEADGGVTPTIIRKLVQKDPKAPAPQPVNKDSNYLPTKEAKEQEAESMSETKNAAFEAVLKAAQSVLESGKAADDKTEAKRKLMKEEAGKAENRLYAATVQKLKEDNSDMKTPSSAGDGIPGFPNSGPMNSVIEDDEADVPEPSDDLVAEADDDKDADDKDKKENPFSKEEAKLVATLKALIRENKSLRYQREVSEAVAATSLANMTKMVKRYKAEAVAAASRTRKPAAVEAVTVRGKNIPVVKVGAVIEALVARIKAAAPKVEAKEAPKAEAPKAEAKEVTPAVKEGASEHGDLPIRTAKGGIKEGKFGTSGQADKPAPKDRLSEAAELGNRVLAKHFKNVPVSATAN